MDEYIYRYVSFESFVNIVQKKALTFVLPSLWDDTSELRGVYKLIEDESEWVKAVLYFIILQKTYAQCWTHLAESDAMWRIYSYGNRALRIKVLTSSITLLENVKMIGVEYSDEFEIGSAASEEEKLLKAFALKRKAFQHECEVRLISHYRFNGTEDAHEHIKAFMALDKSDSGRKILKSYGNSVEESIHRIVSLMNLNGQQKTKEIYFDRIPNFIQGVQVHPFAPQWYVDTVEQFCSQHSIPFEGKSQLYLRQ